MVVAAAVGEAAEAEAADVAAAAMEEEEGGEEEEAEAEAARLMVAGPVACQAERAVAAEAAEGTVMAIDMMGVMLLVHLAAAAATESKRAASIAASCYKYPSPHQRGICGRDHHQNK